MGIPTQAPQSFFAGDTVKWIVGQPDYLPADGWSIRVDLTDASNHYTKTSTDNGDGRHLIAFTATETAAFAAGDYTMAVKAVKGSESYTIAHGALTIRPNLSSPADARSHVKKTLDMIEAYMENPNYLQAASYSIAGRQLSRYSQADLLALYSKYRQLYQQEQNAARLASGQKPRRRLLTRMR